MKDLNYLYKCIILTLHNYIRFCRLGILSMKVLVLSAHWSIMPECFFLDLHFLFQWQTFSNIIIACDLFILKKEQNVSIKPDICILQQTNFILKSILKLNILFIFKIIIRLCLKSLAYWFLPLTSETERSLLYILEYILIWI